MKSFTGILVLFMCSFLTVACSENTPPTTEEKIVFKVFSSLQIALTYDEVCNGNDPKTRYDFDKKENVLLHGHEQMLAARFGGLQHVRFPEESVDDLVKKMVVFSEKVKEKASEKLNAEACDGAFSKQAEKSFRMFTQAHPAQVYSMIDKDIIKQGGHVTSVDEIEAVSEKPSANNAHD